MNIQTLALAFALTIITIPLAFAGSDHDHGHSHSHGDNTHTHSHGSQTKKLNDKGALAAASEGVAAIIEQKQPVEGELLDEAWGNTPEEGKKISKKGKGYYIVSFDNKVSNKALYVLMSDTGEIYDANYSGKFDGLKN
ncbi:DUF6488 family protein [Nitrosomonas communis]|uniref:PepSY domain-containing protein n=1 Tax=Nitrosomonas communis TaxID=44574 RepID=A0A1I4MNL5_9PROT|nr:DUF6488 family protein [Nitrosomonas communis]SFM04627.1 hypothetical protein SAMN05421863_10114 [Nitrosomonas communis]